MTSIPSPPYSVTSTDYHRYSSPYSYTPEVPHLITSSYRALEQQPPPTLREILSAYKTRGDGDREMLLAMLNAKSAEDNRLAETASLHRKMLDTAHYERTAASSTRGSPSPYTYPAPLPSSSELAHRRPSYASYPSAPPSARGSRPPYPTDPAARPHHSTSKRARASRSPSPQFSPSPPSHASPLPSAAACVSSAPYSHARRSGGSRQYPTVVTVPRAPASPQSEASTPESPRSAVDDRRGRDIGTLLSRKTEA